jgi:hypothetical protein
MQDQRKTNFGITVTPTDFLKPEVQSQERKESFGQKEKADRKKSRIQLRSR